MCPIGPKSKTNLLVKPLWCLLRRPFVWLCANTRWQMDISWLQNQPKLCRLGLFISKPGGVSAKGSLGNQAIITKIRTPIQINSHLQEGWYQEMEQADQQQVSGVYMGVCVYAPACVCPWKKKRERESEMVFRLVCVFLTAICFGVLMCLCWKITQLQDQVSIPLSLTDKCGLMLIILNVAVGYIEKGLSVTIEETD